jgi:hypothetical protein
MRHRLPLLLASLVLGAPTLAAGGGTGRPADKKKVDLSGLRLPSLGAVPRAEGLEAPKAAPAVQTTRAAAGPARYEVVELVHAAGFSHGPGGPRPMGPPLTAVSLAGRPALTSAFSTLLRVRSTARVGAPVEVVVLDARGETVLRSSGTLVFSGSDVTHFLVDWEPTPLERGGPHQVLVRVAGEPLGTWPLEIREVHASDRG